MLVSRCRKSARTLLFAGLLLLPAMATGQTFTSPIPISIPSQGPAQPYPSTIDVSGLNAPIESLSVSLGLSHNRPQDLQALLVGPTGASVVLMARAGGIDPAASVVLMFVDGAPPVPFQLTSGFYRPTQVDVTDFEAPAPAPPYGTTLSVFDDTDGNGTWELYVLDLDAGAGGGISGWSLDISTSTRAPLTYQGRLSQDGNPLNDSADLEFSVWDAEVDGNRIGSVMSADNVPVVDGFFTVELPIPHSAFDGSPCWLEVAASSPAGFGPFVTLTPRQRIAATPEATHATTADRATSAMTAANATTAATATTAGSANSVGGVLFNSDGKIGIGTETPEALLDINGRLIVRTPAAVDQTQESSNGITEVNSWWQSFTPGRNGVLASVDVRVNETNPNASGTLEIREGEGPFGSLLATQAFTDLPVGATQWASIPIDAPPALQAGQQYTFRFLNDHAFEGNTSDPYPGGILRGNPEADMAFRTFMAAPGVGIGRTPTNNTLEVAGSASKATAGDWLANSDRRIKTDVRTIEDALGKLDRVRLVSFEYTDDYKKTHPGVGDRRYLNVIAQEFARIFPDHVKGSGEYLPDGSEILQVDTYPLTIYTAAAIQQLRAEKDVELQALRAEKAAELRALRAEKDAEIESLRVRLTKLEDVIATLHQE